IPATARSRTRRARPGSTPIATACPTRGRPPTASTRATPPIATPTPTATATPTSKSTWPRWRDDDAMTTWPKLYPVTELDELAHDFELATIPATEWTHHAHLRVGAILIHRHGPIVALERLRDGI